MSLTSPSTMLVAWVLVPAIAVLGSLGLGIGVQALGGLRLGALLLPAGFSAAVGLAATLLVLGVSGKATVALLLVLVLAGPVVLVARTRRLPWSWSWLWPAASGAAAYLIAMAPLMGSGRVGIVGYVFNDDPAVHTATVALLAQHGAHLLSPLDSSYAQVSAQFGSGYPLGSYIWPLVGTVLTGIDPFATWTPMIAVSSLMTALVSYAVLRRLDANRFVAAAAGAVVASGYLPFSYVAQGSAKEIELATTGYFAIAAFMLAPARANPRQLLPCALGVAGAVAVFGPGALAFLGVPMAVAGVLWLLRSRRSQRIRAVLAMAAAALLAFAVSAPALVTSTRFVQSSERTASDPNQVGNLLGPVPKRETLNIWLAADYRLPAPEHLTTTNILVAIAAVVAVIGIVEGLLRRRPIVALAVVGGLVAAWVNSSRYSIYFAAKSYVVLAVGVGLAMAAGVAALLARRRLHDIGVVLGVLLGGAVLVSDVFVYRGSWMTPKARFQELIDVNDRWAGQGPMLDNEREDYAKVLLRDVKPWESWGPWQPARGWVAGVDATTFHTPDFDDYSPAFYRQFNLLLDRRHPGESAPPSGFTLVQQTPHYRVFKRTGRLPYDHLRVLDGERGVARLNCRDPRFKQVVGEARTRHVALRVASRQERLIVKPATRWAWSFTPSAGPNADYVSAKVGQAIAVPAAPRGRWTVWVRGQLGPGVRVYAKRQRVGESFGDLGQLDGWQRVGAVTLKRRTPIIVVNLTKPSWQAGSSHPNLLGPIALERSGPEKVSSVPVSRARSLCGRAIDWVEVP